MSSLNFFRATYGTDEDDLDEFDDDYEEDDPEGTFFRVLFQVIRLPNNFYSLPTLLPNTWLFIPQITIILL